MKTIFLILFFSIPYGRYQPTGVVDQRITEPVKYANIQTPTNADILQIILEIKVIRSRLKVDLKQKQLDSFFEIHPFKLLPKDRRELTNK